jgi:hypothetical protein
MSTIQPSLPNSAGLSYPQLGQSLINLSANTQPALLDVLSGSDETSFNGEAPSDTVLDVAQQNIFSVLADSTAALGANQTAAGLISSQPSAAYGAQATLSAGGVLGLLENS